MELVCVKQKKIVSWYTESVDILNKLYDKFYSKANFPNTQGDYF